MNPENITATGPQGFLQWLREDQPGLYERVAPVIAQQVPSWFTDFNQSLAASTLGRMGLGQDDDDEDIEVPTYDTAEDTSNPDTEDFESDIAANTGASSDEEQLELAQSELQTTDVADAANTGSTDPSTTSTVSNIVSSTLTTAANQGAAAAYSSLVGQQLQNAQSGLPPSPTSSAASGISQLFSSLSSGGSSSSVLWIGGGLLLLGIIAAAAS